VKLHTKYLKNVKEDIRFMVQHKFNSFFNRDFLNSHLNYKTLKNIYNMKKLFLSFACAAIVLVSCNQSGTEKTEGTDAAASTEAPAAPALTPTDAIADPNAAPTEPVDPATLTSIKFDRYEHNFGKIDEGKSVETVFKFTNSGSKDLIISDAKGSCGCTVPYFPKEPIKPGASSEIKVSYDSKGKSGVQNKSVTITANTDPAITTLNITSEVIAKAGATPAP
jgi:hypothetical protein